TGDRSIATAHDRLICEVELSVVERRTQIYLKAVAVGRHQRLAQIDDLVTAAASALGLVHRDVCLDDELVGDVLPWSGEGHPDACRDRELHAANGERLDKRAIDAGCERLDVGRAL